MASRGNYFLSAALRPPRLRCDASLVSKPLGHTRLALQVGGKMCIFYCWGGHFSWLLLSQILEFLIQIPFELSRLYLCYHSESIAAAAASTQHSCSSYMCSFSVPRVRYLTLLWMRAPTPPTLLPHSFAFFQWGPLCAEARNIFLETFFFFFLCQRVACILAWERRGAGKGALYLPYVGFAVTVADFWNAKSELSVWKSPSVAPPLIFQKQKKKEKAGLAVVVHLSPILTGAERARKAPFQVLSPRVCFPESFCLCCRRVHLVFQRERERERWLLLSFSFLLRRCACIGRCDFYMRASKVGGLVYVPKKNHKIKVCCSESSSETSPTFFFFMFVFVLLSLRFFKFFFWSARC